MKPGRLIRIPILLAMGLFLAFAVSMRAQVQSSTSTTHGAATKTVTVEKGEVVYVSGNHLIVKMDNGEIRDIPNVPESATATVDGKEIGIHDVKVGMKLEKTVTTTTTPRVVTTVETVTGKVFYVAPPNTVILTMDNGQNQKFTIPKDQKFNIDGQMVDAFGLKKGMTVSATKVVEVPETHTTQQAVLSGKMPPPPPPPPDVPVLVVMAPAPAPAPAAAPAETAEAAPATLPKTGSILPVLGLFGALMLCMGLGLRAVRATRS
jgi:hypothetical protein